MQQLLKKVEILANSAKYDASCASCGSRRKSPNGLGGGLPAGVCHSWSADGRCISLLKLLYSNVCRYDCLYCINRRSNDLPRTRLTPHEVAEVTVNFYRRNYIEGLFLSTALFNDPDSVMEELIAALRLLREEYQFGGYVHLKMVPGADPRLVQQAGHYADRLSVNIELPTEQSLAELAPDKSHAAIFQPMQQASQMIDVSRRERRRSSKATVFAPGGQSTQLIVGASPESDRTILHLSETLYRDMSLRRVYYSAYVPVREDSRLPSLSGPPLLREHRLYQADWLLRFYGFSASELLDKSRPDFDLGIDPKAGWALRNLEQFPVEVNRADYEMLLRVPGIGVRSAQRIIKARRVGPLHGDDLRKLGAVMKRARWFLTAGGRYLGDGRWREKTLYRQLVDPVPRSPAPEPHRQLELFASSRTTTDTSSVSGEF